METDNSTANQFSVINGQVHKFGNPTTCPYQTSFPAPAAIAGGGIQIISQVCKTTCPMCNIYVGAINDADHNAGVKKHFIQLTCGSGVVQEYIDEPKNEAPKPKLTAH